ncbi:hypothetical protein K7432_008881 [Basidiobolus ranarum]|uniref:SP-RING-type domain-containing protein n=1 Tax=Basidiobolus ranarum TaxID=34480 RepID=A0ABR2WR73_9FUNG
MNFEAHNKSKEGHWSPEEEFSDEETLVEESIAFPPTSPQLRTGSTEFHTFSRTSTLPDNRTQEYSQHPAPLWSTSGSGRRLDSYRRGNSFANSRPHPYQRLSSPARSRAQPSFQRNPTSECLPTRNASLHNLFGTERNHFQRDLPLPFHVEGSSDNDSPRHNQREPSPIENVRNSTTFHTPLAEPRIVELNSSQGDDVIVSRINMSELRSQYDNATILGINNRLKGLAQKLGRSRTYLHACMELYTWCQTNSAYCFHTEKTLIHCLKIIVRKSRRLGYNVNYGWQVLRVVCQHLLHFQPRRRDIIIRMYYTMCELSNNPVDLPPILSSMEYDSQFTYNPDPITSSTVPNSNFLQGNPEQSITSLYTSINNTIPDSPALSIGDTGEMLRRIGGAVNPKKQEETVAVKTEEDYTEAEIEILELLKRENSSIEIKEENYELVAHIEPAKELPILRRFPISFFALSSCLPETESQVNFTMTEVELKSLSKSREVMQSLEPVGVFLTISKKDINLPWPKLKFSLNDSDISLETELQKHRERHYIDISNLCLKKNTLRFSTENNDDGLQLLQNVCIAIKVNVYKSINLLLNDLVNRCIKAEEGRALVQSLASKHSNIFGGSNRPAIRPSVNKDQPQSSIAECAAESADELKIFQPSVRLSLRCPINHQRIHTPVKGVRCRHAGCFDLHAYLQVNAVKPTWECPICDRDLPLEELRCDVMVENILAELTQPYIMDLELSPHANHVRGRRVDGSWIELELRT